MRATSVFTEAWRNLTAGTSRALLLVVLSTAVLGGVAVADIRAVVDLSVRAHAFRESGAAVQLFSAAGAVDGARCEALNAVPGVVGAGATRDASERVDFLNAPGAGVRLIEATVGMREVLGVPATAASTGLWLSDAASETLGVPEGATLPTTSGPARIAGRYAYPAEAADRTLAHAALAPVPSDGMFNACWVLVWPPSPAVDPLIRATYAGDPAEQANAGLGQLNPRLGAVIDGPAMFDARATAQAPAVAAGLGLALGIGCILARRLELASALHAQVPKTALVLQVWIELLAVMLAVAVVCLPTLYLVASHGNPDPLGPAWFSGLRSVGAGALALLVGGLVTTATTSERRLFRYFKNR